MSTTRGEGLTRRPPKEDTRSERRGPMPRMTRILFWTAVLMTFMTAALYAVTGWLYISCICGDGARIRLADGIFSPDFPDDPWGDV